MGAPKGRPSPFAGQTHTPDTIRKMIEARRMPNRSASKMYRQLDALIVELGVSQNMLAKALGRTRGAVRFWDWRSGRFAPNTQTLEELADALGYEFKLVKKGD